MPHKSEHNKLLSGGDCLLLGLHNREHHKKQKMDMCIGKFNDNIDICAETIKFQENNSHHFITQTNAADNRKA